ncbi:hypothetical protein ElyMa_002054300 [Elysia marginata]|uniref:G-protein coupled receptors family 1 profile domain-containing protein n=1 Tax=Elysia marginata TaxID=1093978 RepID=A0AAV4FAB7_9GAST|nr:hypothetical protein ElyMa_002054300 [Elysia marginata]
MEHPMFNASSVLDLSEDTTTAEAAIRQMTVVLSGFWPLILLFGAFANIMNIVVFLKIGARDNVTILLIALSASDLLFLSLISPTVSGLFVFYIVRPTYYPYDSSLFNLLLYWPAYTAYDLSTYISVGAPAFGPHAYFSNSLSALSDGSNLTRFRPTFYVYIHHM